MAAMRMPLVAIARGAVSPEAHVTKVLSTSRAAACAWCNVVARMAVPVRDALLAGGIGALLRGQLDKHRGSTLVESAVASGGAWVGRVAHWVPPVRAVRADEPRCTS